MGNKQANSKQNNTKLPPSGNAVKNTERASKKGTVKSKKELVGPDYDFLTQQTGLSKAEINAIFEKFSANNPDGKLNKTEFISLYSSLRYEDADKLNEISEFVFRSFDKDKNNYLSFDEFLIAYALTSRGDLRKKLEYAFVLYDADGNGYLDLEEVTEVIDGMLDLLGAKRDVNNPNAIAAECMKTLDSTGDGKISRDEFIDGLLKNFSLRALMNPFS